MERTRGNRGSWAWVSVACLVVLGTAGTGHSAGPRKGVDPDFLAKAVQDILAEAAGAVEPAEEASNGAAEVVGPEADVAPPKGASPHGPGRQAQSVSAPVARVPRGTTKGVPEEQGTYASNSPSLPDDPESWRQLTFSSGSFRPEPGLDPELATAARSSKAEGRKSVYGFLLLKEYLTDAVRAEVEALGVKILGPHGTAHKARFPADAAALERVAALGSVEWLAISKPEQKLSPELKAAIDPAAKVPDSLPVLINLFENVAGFKMKLESTGAVVGKFDRDLTAYRAVVDRSTLDALVRLDFVLYVELIRQTFAGHDQSAASIGVDYIRPGAPGTTFNASAIPLGIMDTGFMLGGAAAVPHVDLNTNACGINFTTDVADVFNDQNGHGSHTLGTIIGRGVGDSRYRGVGIGIGDVQRVRVAKIWDSTGSGTSAWTESAMDFFDDALACGSAMPLVVSISGGGTGTNLVGTDSTARKADGKSYDFGQLYVACGGNTGPGAGTIWTPGVAKNVLAVGNALDNGFLTVGDISGSSSHGPSGDGRQKPNVVGPGTVVTSVDAGTASGYINMSGCSMATPHVSGLAATLMEHYPEFQGRPPLLRSVLMSGALPHDNVTFGDNIYGHGRVDAYSSHWADFSANGWRTNWFWADSTGTGNWIFADINVPAGSDRLVVVLTWDEPAAGGGAPAAVNNDVDLWVDFNNDCGGGQCGEYASQTFVDNVEYVVVNNPPAGLYRLKAYNFNVSQTVHLGFSSLIVQGNPAPAATLTGFASTPTPIIGNDFTITTTVFNPSYIASGVHLENTVLPAGVARIDLRTTREDGIGMSFGLGTNLTLGNIAAGDTRSAVWTFRLTTPGTKVFTFRSWSENAGTQFTNVTVTDAKPDLRITAVSPPVSAAPGDVITVGNTVQNAGIAPAGPFRVGLYLSTDNVCTTGDTLIGSRPLAGLGAGLSSAASTGATIPAGTTLGAYFVCAIADDLAAVAESNEGNNTDSAPLSVLSPIPILNLKVNGTDGAMVNTTGPYLLTLDMSPTTYTGSLDWYWALYVNGQLYWVTSGGLSTVAAPLLSSPPVPFTNLTLLNLNLPVGTNISSAFFVLNGGAIVNYDVISTTVVP